MVHRQRLLPRLQSQAPGTRWWLSGWSKPRQLGLMGRTVRTIGYSLLFWLTHVAAVFLKGTE